MIISQTIAAALRQARQILIDNQIADARLDANLLMSFVLNKNLTFLIAHDDENLTAEQSARFFDLIRRRTASEPLQYIIGSQEFYGLDFEVNENVLIPRPETEFLVEAALEILREHDNPIFCDVGTGSGCISVALAKNLSNASAAALDISPNAIEVARRNAEKHQVLNQITFRESNLFDAFKHSPFTIHHSPFTIILSNPPYIPDADLPDLQPEVREHEPHSALFAGADGLNVIRRLLIESPQYLAEKGFLLFEFGFGQSGQIVNLIDSNVWNLRKIIPDLQAIPRVVVLQKK